ncbi:unnamed protein product [Ectocarpus sp. 12 AP-2014]
MQLRILLGLIGQLVAIPAALFLMPTALPKLPPTATTAGVDSSPSAVEDELAFMTTPPQRLDEISEAGGWLLESKRNKKSKRRRRGGESGGDDGDGISRSSGSRSRKKGLFRRKGEGDLKGVEGFLEGLEEATEGIREAFATFMQPVNELPRKVGGFFAVVARKGGEREQEASPVAESTNKYLAELQLAQESAERALGTPGWAEVAHRGGVTVWKKYFPKDEYGYQYPCVKARGIIEGSAAEVMSMIVDSTRVLEYNRYSKGRTDIEHLGPHTKIVWNKAQPPLSKKLHDFCTLMHMQPLDDEEGSFMLITRATEHPKAPLLDGHVRSEILLGVTILRPAKGDPTRTEMTTVNHIVSNGVPVMIADRVSTKNAIDFIQNVELAALAAAAAAAAAAEAPPVGAAAGDTGGGSGSGRNGVESHRGSRDSVPAADPVAVGA